MSEMDFENQLHSIAKQMNYPRTPDVAGFVTARLRSTTKPRFISKPFGTAQGRRWAWSLTLIAVLFFSLMLIPPARAAILEFIQIGIVRIFPRATEPPIEIPQTATPQSFAPVTATPRSLAPLTPTPYLEASQILRDLSRLAGETTLANAQQSVPYSILLPSYPSGLGEPDHVFVQNADGAMTILVWLDPSDPEKVLMSLHFIPEGSWAIRKSEPVTIQETIVNGQRAVWAVGPYPLMYSNGNFDFTRLIDGYVLIWAEGDVTYRLETNLSKEEAIKIAESLQPIP